MSRGDAHPPNIGHKPTPVHDGAPAGGWLTGRFSVSAGCLFAKLADDPWRLLRLPQQQHNGLGGARTLDAFRRGRIEGVLAAAENTASGAFACLIVRLPRPLPGSTGIRLSREPVLQSAREADEGLRGMLRQ